MARFKTSQPATVSDYFKFSRSQRRAMLFMMAVGLFFCLLLQYSKWSDNQEARIQNIATGRMNSLLVKDSVRKDWSPDYKQVTARRHSGRRALQPAPIAGKPENFDPNTVDPQTLGSFGVSERAIRNIMHYREKGGRFRKPEDLKKLYALKEGEAETLMPFVSIESSAPAETGTGRGIAGATGEGTYHSAKSRPLPVTINVNRSDSLEWLLLPGIGAKRASSILRFREKLGGFVSIEQVGETYGLPDSVFQKIKTNLEWEPGQVEQLSLNHASEAELKAHPYIGWQWAKLMVAYRNQHGPYRSVDDLLKIHIVKKEWLEKVRPYLAAD